MRTSGGRGFGIPALAFALLALVAVDAVRRAFESPPAPKAAAAPRSGPQVPADTRGRQAATAGGAVRPVAGTARMGVDARRDALERITAAGEGTYLPAMLEEDDSVLHRWADGRASHPLQVAVLSGTVSGFREEFTANVAWAVSTWNEIGLPVELDETTDSVGADIVVSWTAQLDGERTGRTEIAWEHGGTIVHASIVLATHLPDGRSVAPTQMAELALHELGHALGLDHSPYRTDALYPVTSATALTARDRRTALLLYGLPTGDLR
jgi:hypothetical protein